MSDYKHDMRHLSCRLNICKHPPEGMKRARYKKGVILKTSKGSMQRANARSTRENTHCTECGSWNCIIGRFKTKCYNCGLEIEHD